MRRTFTRMLAGVLALAGLAFTPTSASAAFQYVSAELDVFNSGGSKIASASVSAAAAVTGQLYEINNAALANAALFGDATSLSTGANPNGPYFVTFGIDDNSLLAFSWDLSGNDPYGADAGIYRAYSNPPTQAQYTFSATYLLSASAKSAGDTASFILTAVPVPEPTSMALLASGGFAAVAFGRLRRKVVA